MKDVLDKFCKTNELKITQWIRSLVINELEKHAQKRYDYKFKKFVEIEKKRLKKSKEDLSNDKRIK
jgi:hypothetical protein